MKCVVEIRDKELYILVGKKTRKGIDVSKAFRIFLTDSFITHEGVQSSPELIEKIKGILKEQKVKSRHIDVVLNHRVALTKEFVLPKVDAKKLDLLATNEMIALFNLSPDYVVDYRVLEMIQEEGVQKYRILASALRLELIQELEHFFKQLKMKIDCISTAVSSFLNFVMSSGILDRDEPIVIIDASTSYLRYYLFVEKRFSIVRSVYIKEHDDMENISKRAEHLLDLMSQSQSQFNKNGTSIKTVKILGLKERFAVMRHETGENYHFQVADMSSILRDKSERLLDYGNSLGMLI